MRRGEQIRDIPALQMTRPLELWRWVNLIMGDSECTHYAEYDAENREVEITHSTNRTKVWWFAIPEDVSIVRAVLLIKGTYRQHWVVGPKSSKWMIAFTYWAGIQSKAHAILSKLMFGA